MESRKLILIHAMILVVSGACSHHRTDPKVAEDAYRAELEAQGGSKQDLATWRVDDGRSVSVMWDFSAVRDARDIQPVIEVPSPGAYPWYTGSKVEVLDPDAVFTTEGLEVPIAAADEPIASAEETNPTDPLEKRATISYWWKRAAGGFRPPGPTLGWEPVRGRLVGTERWPSVVNPGYEFVKHEVRFDSPCPATVKATLSQPPGGANVVVKALAVQSTCSRD